MGYNRFAQLLMQHTESETSLCFASFQSTLFLFSPVLSSFGHRKVCPRVSFALNALRGVRWFGQITLNEPLIFEFEKNKILHALSGELLGFVVCERNEWFKRFWVVTPLGQLQSNALLNRGPKLLEVIFFCGLRDFPSKLLAFCLLLTICFFLPSSVCFCVCLP